MNDRKARKRLLRDVNLPDGRDKRGKFVSGRTMKLVLQAIEDCGPVSCWESCKALGQRCAKMTNGAALCARTVKSAIQALADLRPYKLLERKRRGAGRIEERKILWPLVGQYVSDDLEMEHGRNPLGAARSRLAEGELKVNRVHLEGELSSPSEGELSSPKRLKGKPRKITSSDVLDADGDDERFFSPEDLAEIKRLANELAAWMPCGSDRLDNRELAVKLATLRHDGLLAEDDWQDLIESFERKREMRNLPDSAAAWIWSRLRDRLGPGNLERLLVRCRFPRDLLAAPAGVK